MFDHEVIVVGGGAMGAATAWHLARDGRDVLLLERFEALHDRGSSHGRTRIFRVAYRDPGYAALALAALPWWRTLEDEAGVALLDQCGQIDHGAPDARADIERSLEAHGRPFERLSVAEAGARWPALRTESGVVWSPDGGLVQADRSVDALLGQASAHGAAVHTLEPVRGIERLGPDGAGGVRVTTDGGRYTAPVVVVAAGAWAAGLLEGPSGPLPPGTLPPLAVTLAVPSHFTPRTADPDATWPSVVHHHSDAGPLDFGAYAVWAPGVGMKVGLEDAVRPVDPDDRPAEAPADAVAALVSYVETWFPGLDPSPLDPHLCLFTSTPDEHFVIDRLGPVVVVSPCSGHGFKFVPAIGRLAADLATAPDPTAADVPRRDEWRLRT
ncbi:MAG: FAD-dependent oxidoreductase [Acidimicrobiales bacterium]